MENTMVATHTSDVKMAVIANCIAVNDRVGLAILIPISIAVTSLIRKINDLNGIPFQSLIASTTFLKHDYLAL